MPGAVLHAGATVCCSHNGQATPTTTNARVLVGGQPVVTLTTPYVISGCTLGSPALGNGPCVTAQWITGASRVFASGRAVLITTGQAVCAPTGAPLTAVTAQTRVVAT
jgi:hypothetical protein